MFSNAAMRWSKQSLNSYNSNKSNITPRMSTNEQQPPLTVRSGEFSTCGRKHKVNEDRVAVRKPLASAETELLCITDILKELSSTAIDVDSLFLSCVTDGHGGCTTSQFVSHNVLDCIVQQCTTLQAKDFQELEQCIKAGFKNCEDLLELAHPNEASGCCCLVTAMLDNEIIVAHVGDVRAVLFENGEHKQLTQDHRATDAGENKRITDLGGRIVNNRVQGVLAPSRAFGNSDLKSLLPSSVLICDPTVARFEVDELKIRSHKNSCFVIVATDGVWDAMPNDQACDLVNKTLKATGGSAQAAAKKLAEYAARRNDDDITVNVLVFAVEDEDSQVEADKS